MNSSQPIRIFRSSLKPFIKPLFLLALGLGIFLFLGSIYGFYIQDKTPNGKLILPLSAIIIGGPTILFTALMGILYGMKFLFPVILFHKGIRCYDTFCKYNFVKWEDITDVELVEVCNLYYFYIKANNLSRPITLPLYLDDMKEFIKVIKKKDHIGTLANCFDLT